MIIRPYIWTLAFVIALGFFAVQPHGGVILLILCFIFIVGQPFKIYLNWRSENRKIQLIKAGIWLSAIIIASILHLIYPSIARAKADLVVQAITEYKTKNGVFPLELEIKNFQYLPHESLKHWRVHYWHKPDNLPVESRKPTLMYASTFSPFDMYWYDFDSHSWSFQYD